jgi:hypothetical protein
VSLSGANVCTSTIRVKQAINVRLPGSMAEELGRSAASDRPETTIEWLVPEKYSQQSTSPLTADVTSETTTVDFSLP